ncbi:unnamed protein product (macronuclear) [Paramecium tetraurelia]|uniref:Uncharacterized protein n=1 Tax=Paramecium tetraurelia TaxID=5888 RepID=A0C3M1_PARTE|nr:uncharacterized protein GSPATT00034867001 [Paramecium tetraurelia]CAK65388.1 unnamed protein product [Paramecium tetraurelia]|eukprot:XP_001432785.1 hypothetical protein (macronuclear) [Paramecium tetraurelia strain d4-2]
MLSSSQKSQVYKRTSYLTESGSLPITARPQSSYVSTLEKKELRRYPTEWAEQVDNKTDNRFHHVILNQSKAEHNPNLASPSKIFGLTESRRLNTQNDDLLSAFRRKNQSLSNLGNWQFNSTPVANQSQNTQSKASTTSKPQPMLTRKLDQSVPLRDLLELSRQLDQASPEEIQQLSRGYVNELVQLQQTITRSLKYVSR